MEKFVYLIEGKDYGKLKNLLTQNPYEKDSFSVVGYVLKDSKALGQKGGNYLVYFKGEDHAIMHKLCEQLKALETAKELAGEEKDKIIAQIEHEEDSAASGFGSIFG
jgi:hypothetical protein